MKKIIFTCGLLFYSFLIFLPAFAGQAPKVPKKIKPKIAVDLTATKPDLIVPFHDMTPYNPKANAPVSFVVSVKNIGTPVGSSSARMKVDPPPQGTVGTPAWSQEVDVPALAANGQVWVTFTWLNPTGGPHFAQVCADFSWAVDESNETNNCREFSFTAGPPGLPDLVVEEINILPSPTYSGQSVLFQVVVKNQGAANIDQSCVYLWLDIEDDGSNDLGFGCHLNGLSGEEAGFTGFLAPGWNVTVGMMVPSAYWNAVEGAHKITACADFTPDGPGLNAESNEENNCKEVTFEVR